MSIAKLAANSATANITWTIPTGTYTYNYRDSLSGGLDGILSTRNAFLNAHLSEGVHVISIVAVDAFGNVSPTGSATVTIDATAPIKPILYIRKTPALGSTIQLEWAVPTGTVSLRLEKSFNGGESELVSGNILPSHNDVGVYGELQDALTIWSLPDGHYRYYLYATDAFTNRSIASTFDVTIDTTPPDAPTIYASKPVINGNQILLAWNAPTGTSTFLLKRNGHVVSSNISSSVTTSIQTVTSNGTYVYTLYAIDAYTNTSNVGTSETLTIDTDAPDAPTIHASKPVINGSQISLSWNAPTGTSTFLLKRNGHVVSSNISSSVTTSIQTVTSNGTYVYTLYAIDAYTNTSNVGTSETLTIDTDAPDAPTLFTLTKSALNSSDLTVSWVVPTSTATLTLKGSFNGGVITVVSSNIAASRTFVTQTGLVDGTYVYFLYAIDKLTNTSAAATSSEVVIDTMAPVKPSRFIAAVSTASESTVYLSWVKSNNLDSVSIRKGDTAFPLTISDGTLVTENSLVTTQTLTGLADGTYYFSLFEKDDFNNVSAPVTVNIVIDTKPSATKLEATHEVKGGVLNVTTAVVSTGVTITPSSAVTISSPNASLTVSEGTIVNRDSSLRVSGGGTFQTEMLTVNSGGTLTLADTSSQIIVNHLIAQPDSIIQLNGGTAFLAIVEANMTNVSTAIMFNAPGTITGQFTQTSPEASITVHLLSGSGAIVLPHGDASASTALLTFSQPPRITGGQIILSMDAGAKSVLVPGTGINLFGFSVGNSIRSFESHIASTPTLVLPDLGSRMRWDTSTFDTDGIVRVLSTSSELIPERPLNFPNPFKLATGTRIGYWMTDNADVELRIYTAAGSEIFRKSLISGVDEGAKSGYNKVLIDHDVIGQELPSGVYPYVLINAKKMIGKGRLVVRPN